MYPLIGCPDSLQKLGLLADFRVHEYAKIYIIFMKGFKSLKFNIVKSTCKMIKISSACNDVHKGQTSNGVKIWGQIFDYSLEKSLESIGV